MSRILFVITQSEIGGAQRYLLELAPYLVQKGHEIVIIAGEGDGGLFRKIKSMEYEVLSMGEKKVNLYHIPSLVRNLNPFKDIKALIALIKLIKKERPDILFLQSTKAGFLGSLATKFTAIPHTHPPIRVIYRIGGWSFNDPRPWYMNQILFWMEKLSAPWKNIIIVNSELDRKIAIDKKIAPAEKIIKIYNGIDADKLKFLTRQESLKSIGGGVWNMREEKIIIGTIANLYATKGIEYLIEAAHILTKNYNLKTINYVVIGEGKQRPKLEALIEKYDLKDKFLLVGRVPNASQYLKAFDIFVLPSVKEGFPWVLLEAMAAEVPIIATKVGAVPEIIEDGKDGLLTASRDSKALAEKISKLVESAKEPSKITENALEKLKQFSLQKMLSESEKIINDPAR